MNLKDADYADGFAAGRVDAIVGSGGKPTGQTASDLNSDGSIDFLPPLPRNDPVGHGRGRAPGT